MSDENNNDSSFHFPESDEKQFLEKMERLEGKLDARIERKSCCDIDNLKKEG